MEAYTCQSYALPVGSATIQVCVARRGNLTALATAGTSDIATTKAMQAGCIMPAQADVEGWSPFFSREVQLFLRSEYASFLRDNNTICFAPQHTVRCFLLHSGRQGPGSWMQHSALASRANVAPPWPSASADSPPWATHAPAAGKGREAALSPSPLRITLPSQPITFAPGNSPHAPAAVSTDRPPPSGQTPGVSTSTPIQACPPPKEEDDLPPWRETKPATVYARAAQDAIQQLHALNQSGAAARSYQQDTSDLTLALEIDQNFPTPVPEAILPLRPIGEAAVGEPPDPQGWHPEVDYPALVKCLLPQLQEAEKAGAHVLLLVTDSRCFLSIPHFPFFLRHLLARMQWEGTYKEKWFPLFVNTHEAGLAAVHFTWAAPEILTVLRILAPGVILMLLDHDTLLKSCGDSQYWTFYLTTRRWNH